MSTAAEVLNALYERLLLRDFFGKAIPGSLPLWAVLLTGTDLASLEPLRGLEFWPGMYVVGILIGVGWLVGFVVQGIGSGLRLIWYYPPGLGLGSWRLIARAMKRGVPLNGTCLGYGVSKRLAEASYLSFLHEYDKTSKTERERQQVERLIVLKEACGNGHIAVVAAFAVYWAGLTAASLPPKGATALIPWLRHGFYETLSPTLVALFLCTVVCTAALRYQHVHCREQQFRYMAEVVAR